MQNTTTRKILFFILTILTTMTSFGQLIVANGNDNGPNSLRDAVTQANTLVGPNTITFNGNFVVTLTSGEIEITEDLVITGNGTTGTIIDGASNNARLFSITGGTTSTITMMTLRNAAETGNGGAIALSNAGLVTISDCVFTDNTAGGSGGGGAIASADSDLTITNSSFTGNTATGAGGSGGAVYQATSGTLTIGGSQFSANTAIRAGGAVEVDSDGDIVFNNLVFDANSAGPSPGNGGAFHITGAANSTITGGSANNNIAANEGGAFWNGTGLMTIADVDFENNNANGDDSGASGGGALFNEGGDMTTDANTRIAENFATGGASGSGGGVLVAGGSYTATGTEIVSNFANRAGGGIEVRNALSDDSPATLTLIDVTLDMNNAGADAPAPGNGGGLHITGPSATTITGGSANNNAASNEGGALWNGSGVMTIAGMTIDGNNADGDDSGASGGGGIFNEGGAITTDADTAITNNVATAGASGSGGGLLIAGGSYAATGTVITGNSANRAGGGIEVRNALSDDSPATLELTDVTLDMIDAGADAPAPGNGGRTSYFRTICNNHYGWYCFQ